MQACDTETFREYKRASSTGTRFGVLPVVSGAGVEEDGNEEEIEEAFALFRGVDAGGAPGLKQRCDARLASIKMAPSAMRGDLKRRQSET